ncbi:hypothetical protein [Halomarina litorea]|uniref:hypothetical protein n=1 Tax=Halomarina litorea TaxID=2961595 RepID=UPI0020C51DD2|nr:hypothetical protein [Halomarina sp. BCD28]
MQRRAAAALFVFFLVMGASAYSVIALADAPEINLQEEETYSQGDNFVIDGQRYNVSELGIEESSGGGGHGGGGGAHPAGAITWTVQNASFNETLQNGSSLEYNNGSYLVTVGAAPNTSAVPTTGGSGNASGNQSGNQSGNATDSGNGTAAPSNGSGSGNASGNASAGANATSASAAQTGNQSGNASGNQSGNASGSQSGNQSGNASNGSSSSALEPAPGALVLTEQQDVESILQSDPAVYNSTVTSEGEQFVRYRSNGTFVPLSEYLSTPDQQRFTEGDTFTYQNRTVQVANVTNTTATIAWTAPREGDADLEQGGNVTLANGETYIANFITEGHGNNTSVEVQLSQNFEEYNRQNQLKNSFNTRMNGMWGIIIISGLAGFLVLMLAYIPVRG